MENIFCNTLPYGLIRVTGADALGFLQSQFSNDVRQLREGQAQLSTYCNAKGRMLANFLIHHWNGAYWLHPQADLQHLVQDRLSKFRLRAKVDISDASGDWARLGLVGAHSASILQQALGATAVPQQPNTGIATGAGLVIHLPWPGIPAFLIMIPLAEAAIIQTRLADAGASPADTSVWRLAQIRAGIGMVSLPTSEQHIPQELNLEALGAISFNKGCYPGQEIVARSKYLGKLKNSLYHLRSAAPLEAGSAIYGDSLGEQAIGHIIDCAPATSGFECLAVLRDACAQEALRSAANDGISLTMF